TALLYGAFGIGALFPYWNSEVLRAGLAYPHGTNPDTGLAKWGLRQAAEGLLDNKTRLSPKRPCAAPLQEWFEAGLNDTLAEALHSKNSLARQLIKPEVLDGLLADRGDPSYMKRWGVLLMELWNQERTKGAREHRHRRA